MGTSTVRPNSAERYNAQPHTAEPATQSAYKTQMERRRIKRGVRWRKNPKNRDRKRPAHIA